MKESDQLRKLGKEIRDQEIKDLTQNGLKYLKERISDVSKVAEMLEATLDSPEKHSVLLENLYAAVKQAESEVDTLQKNLLKYL